MNGIITEIQHGSIHDGPGLRSVVFLKGCQLRCFWCHNPEAISPRRQLAFDQAKCLGCGRCLGFCKAHQLTKSGHSIDRSQCRSCFRCVEMCFSGALSICGREICAEDVVKDVAQDIPFYRESGGGITISGGEPGCQAAFTAEILARCREMQIHTAIETNLAYPDSVLETLITDCDLVMADLKHLDPQRHREGTGCGNEQVMGNLLSLTKPLILRTPVVPGFNDDPETIRGIAEFASKLDTLKYYELLTYHPLGCGKAERFGMKDRILSLPSLQSDVIEKLIKAASETGVPLCLNGRWIEK